MAASFAMAGLAGCDSEPDGRTHEVPYVRNPKSIDVGGKAEYATAWVVDGIANGALVFARNGRPLKVEGNAEHPWSRGGTDVFGQASILDLYDPARSQSPRFRDKASSWGAFRAATLGVFAKLRADGGEGLRLLTGPVTSPTLLAQIGAMKAAFPGMVWHGHAGIDRASSRAAAQTVFGRVVDTRWRFEKARVIVSLDGDFLDPGPHQVGVARDWAAARGVSAKDGALVALHAAGALPNLTSAKADFPLVVGPGELDDLAYRMLAAVSGRADAAVPGEWEARAVAALLAHKGAGLVVAGTHASVAVQAAVHRMNAVLGNAGQTVVYAEPLVGPTEPLAPLVAAMNAGEVSALVVLDANPCYDAAGGLGFTEAMAKVPLRIHAGTFSDETAQHSDWHLPLLHPLEAWGDARAWDGTVTLMQPTIQPLYDGRSCIEIVSLLVDADARTGRDILRGQWQKSSDAAAWTGMVRDGFVAGTASADVTLAARATGPRVAVAETGLTVLIRPDASVWDGQPANNAWLQELPRPLTKLVWDNVLTVAPAMAQREGLKTGDVVTLAVGGRSIGGPVWVLPGQADGVVGATLGGGRAVSGLLSYGVGYNVAALRDGTGDPWRIHGVTLRKTGRTVTLATTQDHYTMEGHDFVRVQHEGAAPVGETTSWSQPSLYGSPAHNDEPNPSRDAPKLASWGMVIDLDACIGCNACVVACQSENNIAVVGKDQVALGREMHWLRVDRYYEGPPEAPATRFQPLPCMHCENAPCEVGCPVEATLHDSEGLNLMVYNRCIGTRACSGYCPYKVRHFNYLDYSAGAAPTVELQRNPQVSVRARA